MILASLHLYLYLYKYYIGTTEPYLELASKAIYLDTRTDLRFWAITQKGSANNSYAKSIAIVFSH